MAAAPDARFPARGGGLRHSRTLYLAGRATVRGLGRVIAAAAICCGLALATFSYVSYLPLGLVLMFIVGGTIILTAASVNTILQTIVPDPLRGRVAGFFTLAFLGMAPLGNLAAGALADAVGVRTTFALNGMLAAAAALLFWRGLSKWRELMRPTYRRLGIISDEG
jgi:MFS family permease